MAEPEATPALDFLPSNPAAAPVNGLRSLGLIDEKDLARALGIHLRKMWEQRRSGDHPPFVKDGKRILYRLDAVKEWFLKREQQPTRGPSAVTRKRRSRRSA